MFQPCFMVGVVPFESESLRAMNDIQEQTGDNQNSVRPILLIIFAACAFPSILSIMNWTINIFSMASSESIFSFRNLIVFILFCLFIQHIAIAWFRGPQMHPVDSEVKIPLTPTSKVLRRLVMQKTPITTDVIDDDTITTFNQYAHSGINMNKEPGMVAETRNFPLESPLRPLETSYGHAQQQQLQPQSNIGYALQRDFGLPTLTEAISGPSRKAEASPLHSGGIAGLSAVETHRRQFFLSGRDGSAARQVEADGFSSSSAAQHVSSPGLESMNRTHLQVKVGTPTRHHYHGDTPSRLKLEETSTRTLFDPLSQNSTSAVAKAVLRTPVHYSPQQVTVHPAASSEVQTSLNAALDKYSASRLRSRLVDPRCVRLVEFLSQWASGYLTLLEESEKNLSSRLTAFGFTWSTLAPSSMTKATLQDDRRVHLSSPYLPAKIFSIPPLNSNAQLQQQLIGLFNQRQQLELFLRIPGFDHMACRDYILNRLRKFAAQGIMRAMEESANEAGFAAFKSANVAIGLPSDGQILLNVVLKICDASASGFIKNFVKYTNHMTGDTASASKPLSSLRVSTDTNGGANATSPVTIVVEEIATDPTAAKTGGSGGANVRGIWSVRGSQASAIAQQERVQLAREQSGRVPAFIASVVRIRILDGSQIIPNTLHPFGFDSSMPDYVANANHVLESLVVLLGALATHHASAFKPLPSRLRAVVIGNNLSEGKELGHIGTDRDAVAIQQQHWNEELRTKQNREFADRLNLAGGDQQPTLYAVDHPALLLARRELVNNSNMTANYGLNPSLGSAAYASSVDGNIPGNGSILSRFANALSENLTHILGTQQASASKRQFGVLSSANSNPLNRVSNQTSPFALLAPNSQPTQFAVSSQRPLAGNTSSQFLKFGTGVGNGFGGSGPKNEAPINVNIFSANRPSNIYNNNQQQLQNPFLLSPGTADTSSYQNMMRSESVSWSSPSMSQNLNLRRYNNFNGSPNGFLTAGQSPSGFNQHEPVETLRSRHQMRTAAANRLLGSHHHNLTGVGLSRDVSMYMGLPRDVSMGGAV